MSAFDNFADSPNQIKTEGQEITLKFQRTSDTTARISWNIPPPAHGCAAGTQAYDGIIITTSSTPANYLSTSPKNGVYYDGDLTADADIHSGSVIDKAYVLAALYHDKTTTFIDIDGIKPKTPYYVSGYAVDAVARYHREGVHAYSLPTGIESYDTENYPAQHKIELYSTAQLTGRSLTGLLPDVEYNLPVKIECEIHNIPIKGSDATTFNDLVKAINYQFTLNDPYASPVPPHTGSYYKNPTTGAFYIWDGARLLPINVVSSIVNPSIPTEGMYWLNTSTNVLNKYTSGVWVAVSNIIKSTIEPTELSTYTVWYDGTTVREWENSHWCDYVTIISDTNPQLPPNFNADDYWYNTKDKEFFVWNDKLHRWDDSLVIYSSKDPNTLNTGDFWYDETTEKMKVFVSSNWGAMNNVVYVASDADGSYPDELNPVGGNYWYDTRTLKFYQRNLLNTAWDEKEYISFPVNPRNRKSCDVWWNSSPSVDDLYVWEAVNSIWIPTGNFYRQDTDPNVAPVLDENTAWVKSSGEIYLISPSTCAEINYIYSTTNPRNIVNGMVWLDDNNNYYVYTSGTWVPLDVIIKYPTNPYTVVSGMFWYDMVNLKLYKFGTVWVEECLFVDDTLFPTVGQQWLNTVDNIVFEWSGSSWVIACPYIKVKFTQRKCNDTYDALEFSSKKTGCHEEFEVMSTAENTLFAGLTTSVIYNDPISGWDGVDAGPMFKQLGVGDDGSPDERRALQEAIRMTFGAPAIRVELTKQQLDECINNALLVLRKNSTYAYKKAMFFLDLKPHQQIYKLTNKCVGFNKIVDVTVIHRTKAGAFRSAYSGNDNFAYSAIQQLYTLGTFDMLTYHLASSYIEELETLFASRIMFQWLERKRELRLYQLPRGKERILVEAVIERTEQELLTDRETAYWLKRWAIMEAKGMLVQIRGKFASLPGPNGSTQLNASELQSQLQDERQALLDEVMSKSMQDMVDVGMTGSFIIG